LAASGTGGMPEIWFATADRTVAVAGTEDVADVVVVVDDDEFSVPDEQATVRSEQQMSTGSSRGIGTEGHANCSPARVRDGSDLQVGGGARRHRQRCGTVLLTHREHPWTDTPTSRT